MEGGGVGNIIKYTKNSSSNSKDHRVCLDSEQVKIEGTSNLLTDVLEAYTVLVLEQLWTSVKLVQRVDDRYTGPPLHLVGDGECE